MPIYADFGWTKVDIAGVVLGGMITIATALIVEWLKRTRLEVKIESPALDRGYRGYPIVPQSTLASITLLCMVDIFQLRGVFLGYEMECPTMEEEHPGVHEVHRSVGRKLGSK